MASSAATKNDVRKPPDHPRSPDPVTSFCDIGVFDQRGIEVDGPRGLNRLPG